jgi:hypothetical protein
MRRERGREGKEDLVRGRRIERGAWEDQGRSSENKIPQV